MRTCTLCGHVTWFTGGMRACGTCDMLGAWPRVNGSAVAPSGIYDWAEDEGVDL